MDMMMRRRAIMSAGASASGPLYPMEARSIKVSSSISVTISGNNVRAYTSSNSRGPMFPRTAQASTIVQSSWPVWFTLSAGDEVDIYLKNISYPATSNTPYSHVMLIASDGTEVTGIYNIKRDSDGGELHVNTTIESDVSIKALKVFNYRPLLFVFDIEIYVNGVRYV